MARKTAPSPTKLPIRKNKLKRSTLSSDSLFGSGTPSPTSANLSAKQLSVPKFNFSQNQKSPSPTVIDLTGDDADDSTRRSVPPRPVAKKLRRESPTPSPLSASNGVRGGARTGEEGLWVDLHAPSAQEALAVHPKKVEDVRRWIDEALIGGPNGKLRRYRRILVLTGPSGSGKTATLRILAKEFEAEIVEWVTSSDEYQTLEGEYNYESTMTKLVAFLDRAGSYTSLSLTSNQLTPSISSTKNQKILLLEDLPPLSHPRAKSALHAALVRFAESFTDTMPPLVIILSDVGLRADDSQGYGSRGDAMDIRSVLPPALIGSHYVREIKFNSIAATFMRKALSQIISSRLDLPTTSRSTGIPRETLDALVEASAGDIRSAVMAVQFACTTGINQSNRKSKKKGERDATVKAMFAAVTRREQALALFHLLGRLFYNKRYGDPDDTDEPPRQPRKVKQLPAHISQYERRISKVDVTALHADSPVDTSLFALYVQHNYPQFCEDIDECSGIADALSEADGGMGLLDDGPTTSSISAQYAFNHIARSSLLSLPSPVPRKSQVMRKSGWFAARNGEREAECAVEDAKRWLNESGGTAGWDRRSVVLDAGCVLGRLNGRGPSSMHLFSLFRWESGAGSGDALGEGEAGVELDEDPDELVSVSRVAKVEQEKGYLSDDDIDDF